MIAWVIPFLHVTAFTFGARLMTNTKRGWAPLLPAAESWLYAGHILGGPPYHQAL